MLGKVLVTVLFVGIALFVIGRARAKGGPGAPSAARAEDLRVCPNCGAYRRVGDDCDCGRAPTL